MAGCHVGRRAAYRRAGKGGDDGGIVRHGEEADREAFPLAGRVDAVHGGTEAAPRPAFHHVADVDDERARPLCHLRPAAFGALDLQAADLAGQQHGDGVGIAVREDVVGRSVRRFRAGRVVEQGKIAERAGEEPRQRILFPPHGEREGTQQGAAHRCEGVVAGHNGAAEIRRRRGPAIGRGQPPIHLRNGGYGLCGQRLLAHQEGFVDRARRAFAALAGEGHGRHIAAQGARPARQPALRGLVAGEEGLCRRQRPLRHLGRHAVAADTQKAGALAGAGEPPRGGRPAAPVGSEQRGDVEIDDHGTSPSRHRPLAAKRAPWLGPKRPGGDLHPAGCKLSGGGRVINRCGGMWSERAAAAPVAVATCRRRRGKGRRGGKPTC